MNNFEETRSFEILKTMLSRPPDLRAWLSGSQSYPDLFAIVYFYQMPCGVVVMAEAFNLPFDRENFGRDVFAFHIHEGFECSGNKKPHFLMLLCTLIQNGLSILFMRGICLLFLEIAVMLGLVFLQIDLI